MSELLEALPDDIEARARRVLAAACDADLTIATAESCTGGLLASLLTDVEGASHAFERGFVVYSGEAKCELLGVESRLLDDCGAVSREVAAAMTAGTLDHAKADVAAAITGFAGPGGDADEEGLVYVAAARRGRDPLVAEHHFGSVGRGPVRLNAVRSALSLLEAALAGDAA